MIEMTAALLKVVDLYAGYDRRDVLSGISIEVTKGRFAAVIGPNGHGKTTLMRAICGLIPTRNGSISFNGREIAGLDAASRRQLGIAIAPQGDLLFPYMTVWENLLLGARVEPERRKMRENLTAVYTLFPLLEQRKGQLAYTLSGGERRMLAIGRAIAASSDLLIVDEPSLGLSPRIVDEVYNGLMTLKAQGITVLLVEENVSRATEFGDDIFLVDQGRVVWSGTCQLAESSADILSTYLGR